MSESAEVQKEDGEAPEKSELELMKEAAEQRKPYVMKLNYPIDFGKERIAELVVHRPKAPDMKKFQFGGTPTYGDYIDIAARLCRRDVAVLNQLDIEDSNRLVVVTGFFCGLGLPTGAP